MENNIETAVVWVNISRTYQSYSTAVVRTAVVGVERDLLIYFNLPIQALFSFRYHFEHCLLLCIIYKADSYIKITYFRYQV